MPALLGQFLAPWPQAVLGYFQGLGAEQQRPLLLSQVKPQSFQVVGRALMILPPELLCLGPARARRLPAPHQLHRR